MAKPERKVGPAGDKGILGQIGQWEMLSKYLVMIITYVYLFLFPTAIRLEGIKLQISLMQLPTKSFHYSCNYSFVRIFFSMLSLLFVLHYSLAVSVGIYTMLHKKSLWLYKRILPSKVESML